VTFESLCMGCMQDRGSEENCPHCGWREGNPPESPLQLPPRTVLDGRYLVGRALGQGGFGITYLGWDLNLDRKLAVKEYFPRELCTRGRDNSTVQALTQKVKDTYGVGLTRFLDEGRALARFQDHPGIVAVLAYFQENGTGYIVMAYVDGLTFGEYLEQRGGRVSFEIALNTLIPVMDTLNQVHAANLLHRDVSPDNIYITRSQQVKLLDFGAARYAVGEQSRSLDIILKPGYAPEEQYRSRGRQGPWTDVYAVGATLYRALTGEAPPPALDRLAHDDLEPPSRRGVQIPAASETVLLKALALRQEDRFQTIAEFQHALIETSRAPDLSIVRQPEPPKPREDARKKPEKRRLLWGIAFAVIALCVGAVLVRILGEKHPAIVSFTVTPTVVSQGGSVSLRWQTRDSNEVLLDGQKVPLSGERTKANLLKDSKFTLTITGPNGVITSASAAVEVKPPLLPPRILFSVFPRRIESGKSVAVRWDVQNASQVFLDDQLVPNSGSKTISGLTESRNFNLRVSDGAGKNIERSVAVAVQIPRHVVTETPPVPKPAEPSIERPSISFRGDHEVITRGQSVALHWSVTGATRVHIVPGFPVLAPAGTVTVSPSENTDYLLLAEGPGGSASKQFSVRVLSPALPSSVPLSIIAFSASPTAIPEGSSAVLRWDVRGAARVTISPNIGVVGTSGSLTIRPANTTLFTLVASASDGSSIAQQLKIIVSPR